MSEPPRAAASFRRSAATAVRRDGKRWIAAGVLLGVLAVLIFLIPWVAVSPNGLTKPQLLSARNDLRGTLLQSLAGLAVAGGAYVAWRKLKDEREASSLEHELDRESQITERLTRAIEQLGSEKLQVRTGGIYALERIALDSPRDQGAIVEVLTVLVRETSSLRLDDAGAGRRDPQAPPPYDVQAALTVLGRRNVGNDPSGLQLHLYDSWLANSYLFDANLDRAWLHRRALLGPGSPTRA